MKNMTTVQMEKPLVCELEKLKAKYKVSSYKAVVWKLMEKEKNAPKDLFGAFPDLPKFRRNHKDFHDL